MRSTGIVRRIDELGRVVLPMELRNQFGISEKDPMEIYVNGSAIMLKKFEPACTFCGSETKLVEYKNRLICHKCTDSILKLKA